MDAKVDFEYCVNDRVQPQTNTIHGSYFSFKSRVCISDGWIDKSSPLYSYTHANANKCLFLFFFKIFSFLLLLPPV